VRFGESDDLNVNPNPSEFGGTVTLINETTDSRIQQQKNRDLIIMLVRQVAITEAIEAALAVDYESYDQTKDVKDRITEAIDDLLNFMGNIGISVDEAFVALRDLRAKTIQMLTDKGATLERIIEKTVPSSTIIPAVVLAYDLYEDIEREDEIIQRNVIIKHPGFLPGGQVLEVLNA
jgi:prophage DNA circulation protein